MTYKLSELLEMDLLKSEISIMDLEKFSDLLCIDLEDIFEKNIDEKISKFKSDFNKFNMTEEDLNSISQFNKIVKNYIKMKDRLERL